MIIIGNLLDKFFHISHVISYFLNRKKEISFDRNIFFSDNQIYLRISSVITEREREREREGGREREREGERKIYSIILKTFPHFNARFGKRTVGYAYKAISHTIYGSYQFDRNEML